MELDAVGGAATGGLIGAAIERPAGQAGEHHAICSDCGAEVLGRFCQDCGQPAHVHRTLLHLGEELLHGVMHFDSRIWRTLPLLVFRPGKLTREWVHGRRTRYVSPLAMYLFTVFSMFMVLSFVPLNGESMSMPQLQAAARQEVARKLQRVTDAEAAAAKAGPEQREDALDRLKDRREDLDEAREELAELQASAAKLKAGGVVTGGSDLKAEISQAAHENSLGISTGSKKLDEKIRKKLENPDLAIYKLQQTFYKFSFLLVPISIPFVALLFLWKRGVTLYDHGVFVLYSLTFMAALMMALPLGLRFAGPLGGVLAAATPFIVPAHMFAQVKGAYGLSFFSALWRTFMLLIFCSIALALFVLAIIWLGWSG